MPEQTIFVGLDVSKARLDVHLHPLGRSFSIANNKAGHTQLVRQLNDLTVAAIGLEASGGYERDVARALAATGHTVKLLDPARVRAKACPPAGKPDRGAKALGRRAKTDRIDAAVIARAAAQLDGAAPELDPARLRLRELLARRSALIEQRKAATLQLDRLELPELKRLTRRLVAHLERMVTAIERAIADLVAATPALAAAARRLATAPGVGPTLAATLLARLPELGQAPAKATAALAGVAPFARQSGSRDDPRHIAGGRADLRAVLYMATLSAVRANPPLRVFYQRLRQAGKPAKVALAAAMRKLLTMLDAMLRKGEDWRAQAHAGHG